MAEQPISIKVWSVLPYRSKTTRHVHPVGENVETNQQLVWALKNGRAWENPKGVAIPFLRVVDTFVGKVEGIAPLKPASDATVVPVPRSGASLPAFSPDADPYPCKTIASRLAEYTGAHFADGFVRSAPPAKKRSVAAGVRGLAWNLPVPTTRRVLLIDDTLTTGATLVATAIVLRRAGFSGEFCALFAGATVHTAAAGTAQPKYLIDELSWDGSEDRPVKRPIGGW